MTVKNKAEILAPAGGFEALKAAVQSGADAVYFGGKTLNARRTAENFDDDQILEAVRYCHSYGRKAYVTLNTLMRDGELGDVLNLTRIACKAGADALIVQDLGLARAVASVAQGLTLHASTQMSVHTEAGLKLLADLGFKRVVLPRELSKEEIEKFVALNLLETEVFVHGALCMSFSGQCYMSAVFGSRSGNRGLCAGPCRLPFAANGAGTGYDLSLKDLSLVSKLRELEAMGVNSFKIEGRLKRPEYVATAVTACREALAGRSTEKLEKDLKAVFSRSGFTDGYYNNNLGKNMFGTRQKEDVVATAGVLPKLTPPKEKEKAALAVNFDFFAREGRPIKLKASSSGLSVSLESDFLPEIARNVATDEDRVRAQLKKCGDYGFYAEQINADLSGGLNIPLSVINELRRRALEELKNKLQAQRELDFCEKCLPKTKAYRPSAGHRFVARFGSLDRVPEDLLYIKEIILPYDIKPEAWDAFFAKGLEPIAELPRLIFREEALRERLKKLKARGLKKVFAGTLDGLAIAKDEGFEPIMGIGSNIFNSRAVEAYDDLGAKEVLLSFELTLAQGSKLEGALPRGVVAYGRLPLMITRNCPIANATDCKSCSGKGFLRDRKGVDFPVMCSYGYSTVYNSRPLYLADKYDSFKNFDFSILYFTDENKEESLEIIKAYLEKKAPTGEFTRGLGFRSVD